MSQLDVLGSHVASVLEDGSSEWSWRPNPPDWAPGGHLLNPASGIELYLRLSDRDKLAIIASPPKDSRGQVPYVVSRSTIAIHVSAGKSPQQIARDIERRLLPVWLPLYEQALAAIAASDQHARTTSSIAAEIANITGGTVDQKSKNRVSFYRSPHPIFHEMSGGAEVSGETVHLDLTLSHEDAVALLRAMIV